MKKKEKEEREKVEKNNRKKEIKRNKNIDECEYKNERGHPILRLTENLLSFIDRISRSLLINLLSFL